MGGRQAVAHLGAPASGASPDEPQPTGRPRAPNSSLLPKPHFSADGPSSVTLGLTSPLKASPPASELHGAAGEQPAGSWLRRSSSPHGCLQLHTRGDAICGKCF